VRHKENDECCSLCDPNVVYRVFTRSSKHRAGSSRPIRTPPLAQMQAQA